MTTRWEVERAVFWSRLEPPARLILLALLHKADNQTALVAEDFTPSLSTLEAMTGLSRSTVRDWLNGLEDAGWVVRTRRARGGGHDATTYALAVGSPTVSKRPRKRRLDRAPDVLGRQTPHPDRAPGAPEVGRVAPQSRAPGALASSSPKDPSLSRAPDAVAPAPRDAGEESETREPAPSGAAPDSRHRALAAVGVSAEEAVALVRIIEREFNVRSAGWWHTVRENGDLPGIVAAARRLAAEQDQAGAASQRDTDQPATRTHAFEPTKYGLDAPCGRPGCGMPVANRIHFHTLAEIRRLLACGPDGDPRLYELLAGGQLTDAENRHMTMAEHDEWHRRAELGRRGVAANMTES